MNLTSRRGAAPLAVGGLMLAVAGSHVATAQSLSRPPVLSGEPWIAYQGGTVAVGAGGTTPLHLVRADGTDDHLLVPDDPRIPDTGHPDWSPDGSRVAFDVWIAEAGQPARRVAIWTIAANGSDAREVAACELPCLQLAYPTWSPDGSDIALIRYDIRDGGDWGPNAIEVLDPGTRERRVVAETADGTTAFYDPRWAPDGRSLVATLESYTDETAGTVTGSSIITVDATGPAPATPTVITPPDLPAAQPDWGPDDTIAFVTASRVGGWADDASLMTVQTDGSGLTPLVVPGPGQGIAGEPAWVSEDRIMFVAADATGERIAWVSSDGSGLEREAWLLQTPHDSIQRTHAHLRPVL